MPFINIPSYGAATWKEAVSAVIDLPASGNILGDARVVETTSEIYIWDGSAWVLASGGGGGITDLTGDVTAVGPGSAAATVAFVGGETAADVATSVQDTQAATDASTASVIVKRDASSKTSLKGLKLDGGTSGTLTIDPPAAVTSYSVVMPAAQGAASSVLQNDGAGNLSWTVPLASVTSVGATAPVASSGGTTPTISMAQSSAVADGYLSSADWTTFNNKASYPAFSDDRVLYSTTTGAEWRTVGTGSTAAAYPTDTVILGRTKPASVTGERNIIIGTGTCATALTSGADNVIIGDDASPASTTLPQSVVIGSLARVSNNNGGSVSIGYNAQAGMGSVCIGVGTTTWAGNDVNGVSVGRLASSSAGACAIGGQANASSVFTTSIGTSSLSSGSASTAIGYGAQANSTGGIAIGRSASTNSIANALAIGSSAGPIQTMYLGRGAANQTAANAVKIMTMIPDATADRDLSVGSLTLAGSQSNGGSAGGEVIIATSPAGTPGGTTANPHVERIRAKSATEVVVNDTGVDFDFRVEGDNDANLLFVDASTDRVGINVVAPTKKLHVFDGSNQCVATFQSDTIGGGITLQDSTTTSDTHVGIGANGDDLCFRSGGFVGANMTLDASGNLKVPNYILSPVHYDEGTETTNFTIDWANSPVQTVTLNGTTNAVVTLSNPINGGAYALAIIQGATPGTIDFTAGGFASVKWPGGTAPTLSSATGEIDIINLLYIGTDYYATFATDFS